MRAVVNATEDLLLFILSQKGRMVRIFLIRDVIKTLDSFPEDVRKSRSVYISKSFHVIVVLMQYVWVQGDSTAERVVNGLRLLRTTVKSMPEVWAAMMLRICLQPDMHRFAADMASALVRYSCERFPETFWLRLSTLIHKISAT